ncbi:MAG: CHAT domain-containing protein [Sulfuricella sp.]|nr:CHAT domain-containing protein [Sulfuricella sp.]
MLSSYANGNLQPIRELLSIAWDTVTGLTINNLPSKEPPTRLQALSRLLYHWQEGEGILDWRSVVLNDSPVPEAYTHLALSSLIFGDTVTQLSAVLVDRHHRRLPQEADPFQMWQHHKKGLGELMGAYPMRSYAGKLGKRLHELVQLDMHKQLAQPDPDLNVIWSHLERGRIALNGARQPLKQYEVRKEASIAVLMTVFDDLAKGILPHTNALYRPFTVWLEEAQRQGLVLEIPTYQKCQAKLTEGAALVQPFFDDEDRLHVLWLSRSGPPSLETLPGLTGTDWKPLLDAWRGFVESTSDAEQLPEEFTPAWECFTAPDSPARILIEWLKDQAQQREESHLIVLWPGRLAQFPFEAVEWVQPGFLERAVSLSALFVERRNLQNQQVLFDDDFKNTPFAEVEASAVANHLGVTPTKGSQTTLPDGLLALSDSGRGHWVVHGKFTAFDPLHSHFQLNAETRLPAWALGAVEMPGSCFTTAACEALLSGSEAHELLASAGLAAQLNVRGAATVIGPLWRVDAVASFIFFDTLYGFAKECPGEPWSSLVARAQQFLQEMGKEQLKDWLDTRLANHPNQKQLKEISARYIGPKRPFVKPYFWAPFAVIGQSARTA